MSAPAPEVDFSETTAVDISREEMGAVPDHTASREERRGFLSYFGAKPKTEGDERPNRGRARVSPPRRQRKRVSNAKKGAFVEPLMQMYGMAGMALMMRDPHCGKVVMQNAEKCAEAVDELAYQNESVRRVLDSLVTGSAIGAVVMAHAPIMMALTAHHGKGRIPFVPDMSDVQDSAAA